MDVLFMKDIEGKKRHTSMVQSLYYKQGYRFLGRNQHSAVKICRWTKESLRKNRMCYKELWYPPVESHRCMQMTPYLGCNDHCLFCWRMHSGDRVNVKWREFPLELKELDEPKEILKTAIEKRRSLLIGFQGNSKLDEKKIHEALNPTMMTMSLTGEPTLYPQISELIFEAERLGIITFLVTNGTQPNVLETMDPLPFQLYVSVSAPDRSTHNRITRPLIKNGWERLNRTLEILPSLQTRKVIRFTVIKGWNTINHRGYADLIKKAEPHYIEVKAYEWVGASQKRLPKEAMPFMKDVSLFAQRISELTGYQTKGEYEPSGVILLA
jgi:tRNA wybutosine-synthesizing protein 1